jgi:hypothetical protein
MGSFSFEFEDFFFAGIFFRFLTLLRNNYAESFYRVIDGCVHDSL